MKEKQIKRGANIVKDDMLQWVQQNIYARMGKEWDYRGQDFDPLVHLLVGAFASEIKTTHEAINDSDRRVLKQLAQMLLPEAKHLPTPAHTLVKVNPANAILPLSETLQLNCTVAGQKVFFSPVFEQTLSKLELKTVVSDLGVFSYNDDVIYDGHGSNRGMAYASGTLSHLLLGFKASETINSTKNLSFYFDLKGIDNNKSPFIDAVTRGTWYHDGVSMLKKQGFADFHNLESVLDSSTALQSRIESIYRKNFASIIEDKTLTPSTDTANNIIDKWIKDRNLNNPDFKKSTTAANQNQDKFIWIEVHLAYPVTVNDFFSSFCCSTQVFPAVNRKLEIKDDGETYFDTPALNIIQIQTQDSILCVKRVMEKQNAKNFIFKPLAYLKGDLEPSYSIRYGGIGRLDNYNVWQRCAYLLSVFREEHKMNKIAEKISPNISLEDLHLLLGEKISKDDFYASQNPQNYMYIFMHPGFMARGMSALIEYWTTLGDFANDIPSKHPLIAEYTIAELKKEEKTGIYGYLLNTTSGGKKLANDTELFHALKDAIVRKERLVTPNDIVNFCRSKVQNDVKKITTKHGVDLDTRPDFGISRTIEVYLEVFDIENPKWNSVCMELEQSLNENALTNIPFRVKLLAN